MMNYDFANDIRRMREFHDLSTDDFALKSLVSRADITRLEAGQVEIQKKTLDNIYSYSYNQGLNLNKEKARFLTEDKKDSVVLFHGAKGEIAGDIDARHSSISNDFSCKVLDPKKKEIKKQINQSKCNWFDSKQNTLCLAGDST